MDDLASFHAAQALHQSGRLAEARRAYAQIIARDPRQFEALCQLAIVAFQLGDLADALRQSDLALAVNDQIAGVHSNRGTFLLALGRYEEAVASLDRAVALDPRDAQAHNNRGIALQKRGRFAESLASIDRAIALNVNYAKAYADRGYVLIDLQRFDEAIASCDRALALRPDYAEAHDNRGVALFKATRFDEALASFDRALELWPDYAVSHRNRGAALESLKRYEEAIASFTAALSYDTHIELAAGTAVHLSLQICDWRDLGTKTAAILARIDAGELASPPFPVLCMPSSLARQRAVAATYVRQAAPHAAALKAQRAPHAKIRIGYFSPDFHDHAVAHALAGVFEAHDKSRFEVTGFLLAPRPQGRMRARIEHSLGSLVDVSTMADAAVSELAYRQEIDIAVDLAGHTTDSRPGIFTARAAPLQVSYLGYPGTWGGSCIDYLIADQVVIPAAHRPHYAENIVTLPHSFFPTDDRREIAGRLPVRAELGLPESGTVYCCFNNTYKITPEAFDVWMRILGAVEGSVLWLAARDETARGNLAAAAEKRGISGTRLVFNTYMDRPDHLARHRAADLFLDTFIYGAHSTAADALQAGLPVLTKLGETFAGRVGASLVYAAGLPELVVTDVRDYERTAIELGRDSSKRAALNRRLAENLKSGSLFDTAGYTRALEAAFALMWERHINGLPPGDIRVPE